MFVIPTAFFAFTLFLMITTVKVTYPSFTMIAVLPHMVLILIMVIVVFGYEIFRRHYEWWASSGLHDEHRRGLTTCGYPLLGFIDFPNIPPELFDYSMKLLLAICVTAYFSMIPAILPFALFTVILAQLWAQEHVAYHRECLLVTTFLYLTLWHEKDVYGFTIGVLKLHIASIYTFGAVWKLLYSLWRGRAWWRSAPQTFLWNAMWSSRDFTFLQYAAMRRPRLVAACGLAVVVLELLAPLLVMLPHYLALLLALSLFCFHIAVYLLQGIDYVTMWASTLLLVCSFETPTVFYWPKYFMAAPWLTWAPLVLFSAQLLFASLEGLNINIPPFTCCPMFINVCTMTERIPKTFLLRERKPKHDFVRLEWMFPYARKECGVGLVEEDLQHIPYRFILFGVMRDFSEIPELQRRWLHTNYLDGTGFYLYTNMDLPSVPVREIREVMETLHEQLGDDVRNQYGEDIIEYLIDRHQLIVDLFDFYVQSAGEKPLGPVVTLKPKKTNLLS